MARPLDLTARLLEELMTALASAPSGLAFVYHTLDLVVRELGLDDAVLVTGGPGAARQAFRYRRQPLDGPWAGPLAVNGDRGLTTVPLVLEPELGAGVLSLCEVALRLDRLEHDASHDALTGLVNRRSFDALLDQAISRSRRYGLAFSLVMFDLNRFKDLNDRLGHAAGDRVLEQIGEVLRSTLRSGDVAARIGGDEFALLLDGTDAIGCQALAARLVATVREDLAWAGVGISVGVASAPDDGLDGEELCRLADERVYEAKSRS